jgi:molecular chaperone IbpA
MRTACDFSALFRSSVGFDRVFDLIENAAHVQTIDSWPPYSIEKTGNDRYRITRRSPASRRTRLTSRRSRTCWSCGEKSNDEDGQYLHRGIAARSFERRFGLADHVKVVRGTGSRPIIDRGESRRIAHACQ